MRKIYSLVLMTTMLLVGTNVWAQNTVRVVNHTYPNNSGDYANLQAAFDAVRAGDSATITLLANQELSKVVVMPHVSTTDDVAENEKIINRDRQRICLDLNGFDVKSKYNTSPRGCFIIFKGLLHITGEGEVTRVGTNSSAVNDDLSKLSAILLYGAPGNCYETEKDRSNVDWTTLIIDENVKVKAPKPANENGNYYAGITVYAFRAGQSDLPLGNVAGTSAALEPFPKYANIGYCTFYKGYYDPAEQPCTATFPMHSLEHLKPEAELADQRWQQASAYGVKAIINGEVYGAYTGVFVVGIINQNPSGEHKLPYIYVGPNAKLHCNESGINGTNGGLVLGGYAISDVRGEVFGQTGITIKSGEITLTDATVYSTSDQGVSDGNLGGSTSGSAIFIASDTQYAGNIDVNITGDTKVTGNGGAAIIDVVADNTPESEVSHLDISGGTIEGGDQGAIAITTGTAENTTFYGGTNIEGGTTVEGAAVSESDFVAEGTHVTTVTNEEGNTVIVVSSGVAPTGQTTIAGHAGESVKWTGASENISADIALNELEINESTPQELTVDSGNTLTVGRVILGENAQIIVEPGAKFIVTGAQGIVAPNTSNIVLKSSETVPAVFLFNPAVTSNRHPKATVEFISKSFVNAPNWARQCFGIPTIGALSEITAVKNNVNVGTTFGAFNYEANVWEVFGGINKEGYTMDYSRMANPFDYYQMINYATEPGTVVTMKGNLVGNDNPQLNIRGNFWNGFANSFMGPMNIGQLIDMIPGTVDKAIYLLDVTQDQTTWNPLNLLDVEDDPTISIQPLQPFLIRNTLAAEQTEVDFADAVYCPTVGGCPTLAPRRTAIASDFTKAKLIVRGENCIDRVTVVESDDFSEMFDNGYDAAKYMNDGINMYVTADEKMSIFATNNLENTFVGLQTINGGNYTIEFVNVQGENLTLIDIETGVRTLMTEGNTYQFTATANTTNDYRFKIVGTQNMPTDVENVSAAANDGSVYSIMGQYVGKMTEWDKLPAGIYVVDGVKRVK